MTTFWVYISLGLCYGEQGKYLLGARGLCQGHRIKASGQDWIHTELAQHIIRIRTSILKPKKYWLAGRGPIFKQGEKSDGRLYEGTSRNYNRLREALSRKESSWFVCNTLCAP